MSNYGKENAKGFSYSTEWGVLLYEFYKKIEAQIWSGNYPKLEYGKIHNESLDKGNYFRYIFGVNVGWQFGKMRIIIE